MSTTWKQVVLDTADAVREANGSTAKIPVGQLADKVRAGAGIPYEGENPLTIGQDGYNCPAKTLLKDGLQIVNGVNGEDLTGTAAEQTLAVENLLKMVNRKVAENRGVGQYVWRRVPVQDGTPLGYVKLDYLESSGTQYVNTGIIPNQNTRVVCDFQFVGTGVYQFAFGSRTSSSSGDRFAFMYYGADSTLRSDYYSDAKYFSKNIDGLARHTVDKKGNICTIEGETVTNTSTNITGTYPMFMFALNNGGIPTDFATMRIWSMKVYSGDILVADLTPHMNINGRLGYYDSVNNVFHESEGSGDLTCANVPNVNYVVASDINAYPNGGEQDGYWYELYEEREVFEFTNILGYSRCSVSTFTFSSRTAVNNAVTHPFAGDIPYFAMIAARVPSTANNDLYLAVGIKNLEANSGTLNTAAEFYYNSSQTQKINRGTSPFAVNRNATGNIYIDSNSIYYTAGVEYYLIVAL